ncbi:MAG: OmpA family protein [Alphaproteobacteria bacterium]|nr:OmpA family protein [Alphaproteobacteria bacterium]
MSSSKRLLTCLKISSLTLALAACPAAGVLAQASVETYIDQAVPDAVDPNLMPEGMVWNRPLKAGEMVLPRLTKPAEKKAAQPAPRLPVGELKAPLLSTSKKAVQAPQAASSTTSTQSMMLLQGMKSALKQAGQNSDIPPSENVAIDPAQMGKDVATSNELLPSLTQKGVVAAKGTGDDSSPSYVKGQEPKELLSGAGPAVRPSKDGEDGYMDIVFPSEMAAAKGVETTTKSAGTDSGPKATELDEQPLPLESASTKKSSEPGLLERMAKPFSSIFGKEVEDKEPAKKEAAAPAAEAKTALSDEPCVESVTKWTRPCAEGGYPAHFNGEITGETRKACPSGTVKDVWLTNTCAEKGAKLPSLAAGVAPAPQSAPVSTVESALSSSAIPVTMAQPEPDTMVDGGCGVANGLASEAKPAGDLCSQGEATAVLGTGPWRWSCKGRRGGMTVSCAAPVAPPSDKSKDKAGSGWMSPETDTLLQVGQCGSAEGAASEQPPADNLCAKGTASRVNGSGPWTWACSGSNGGGAAACMAPRKTNGECGSADGVGFDVLPSQGLCQSGYASAVTGEGPWNWTCSGLYGGSAATCSAKLKVNAICGPASMRGHLALPKDGLCNVGNATAITGNGPWAWSCEGALGGATVRCAAPISQDGVCGSVNGTMVETAPAKDLCSVGTSTRVTGNGPWSWNCAGVSGGNTVSCTALSKTSGAAVPQANGAKVSCGAASETFTKPSDKLCVGGKATPVEGEGPWTWSCESGAGQSISCSTLEGADGVCGAASGVKAMTAPDHELCSSGLPTEVIPYDNTTWRWSCKGGVNAKSIDCSAPMAVSTVAQPRCGTAHGMGFADKPDSGLCEVGKASSLKGSGPWGWTCAEGKAKVTCEALRTIEGTCGNANGSVVRTAPASGLCTTGMPTDVTGAGPWMWSCVGVGGGGSASCSATSQADTKVDGVCGASSGGSTTDKPSVSLCDSGMPSTVYGEGPWTWTCSGMNGGLAATCAANRVVPKAPPPPGPKVNGVCGYSNGVASLVEPEDGLCSNGMATALSGSGPWNWSCIGANGGMTVSCTSPLQPPAPIVGECGSSTGVPTLTTPKSGLCAAGISSAVSGKGPWTWSCSGTNGGGAVSCVAPLAGKGSSTQSIPSMVTPSLSSGNEAPAPKAAPVGLVTPQLSSSALPAMKPGTVPDLKVVKKNADKAKTGKDSKTAKSKKVAGDDEADLTAAAASMARDEIEAPLVAPELPEGIEPLPPPPLRETAKPVPGQKAPVLDSTGKPVAGARLVLDPELTTISFAGGSDQLDKESVEIVEKLTKVLIANGQARITLTAYADTSGERSPRDARRLSLNRALTIRDFMTSKGLSSGRVDIRPMGANVPSGDMDRVDVKVN